MGLISCQPAAHDKQAQGQLQSALSDAGRMLVIIGLVRPQNSATPTQVCLGVLHAATTSGAALLPPVLVLMCGGPIALSWLTTSSIVLAMS